MRHWQATIAAPSAEQNEPFTREETIACVTVLSLLICLLWSLFQFGAIGSIVAFVIAAAGWVVAH